ncbi:MAG: arginine N-succinyltransferase [Gammaproteobacteria bacterium]|jgi:arginine N-succinyltransferase|uniref:arginine N-succinyltransferase n=1 Tax=Nevskia sp. TaxID=1929292 RepID=UPI003F71E7FD|nr:arginine N-succinyltransferase [Gammaproteobacteria bacterium]
MKIIRPIRHDDLPALLDMARNAGAGFTSLPPVPEFLAAKIALSEASFAADVHTPGHQRYLFVMEETETGDIGAACAIEAACGLDEAFYNYRVGLAVHASRELGIYNSVPTLYLSNDLTGSSVLCSLYLRPDFRGLGAGKLLSKCRFLFMAHHPQRFAKKVIAEMRGVSDEQGRSPFWEGLGRHFFTVDYAHAEHIVGTGNKAFIAELMPPHPIYTVLLPEAARAVMGQVHPETAPALHLLEQEGFRYQGYIDIFDGGPSVEAPLEDIRSIRRAQVLTVFVGKPAAGAPCLIANTELANFRCAYAEYAIKNGHITLPAELAAALEVDGGDEVRVSLIS